MIDDEHVYVVVDIETDGPVPGIHSMLSIGAVATSATQEVSTFYRTILPMESAQPDPDTAQWWRRQPDLWKEVTTNAIPAVQAMREFLAWIDDLGKKPVFVAHPIGFDYAFVNWYLFKFAGMSPFVTYAPDMKTLDLQSFMAGKLGLTVAESHRSKLEPTLLKGMPDHTHNALDDARGYAVILRNVLNS